MGGKPGKKHKRRSGPAAAALGTGAALAAYLLLLAAAAALALRGTIPEESLTAVTAVCCFLAVLVGGSVSAGGSTWRPMGAAFSVGAVMAVLLVLGGLSAPEPPDWAGQGGGLVLCALGGGALAGFLAAKRAKKRRRHG